MINRSYNSLILNQMGSIKMKFYSTKANAKRAAKKLGHNNFELIQGSNGWAVQVVTITVEEMVGYNPQLLLPAPKLNFLIKSSVDNPVKMVWEIADKMWGERRKDIIQKCVDLGIAYNTARTQYQAFYQVKKLEGKK